MRMSQEQVARFGATLYSIIKSHPEIKEEIEKYTKIFLPLYCDFGSDFYDVLNNMINHEEDK